MAKRRKRTSNNVPAKGRLKELADQLWSLAIKDDWNHACAICGHRGDLNSHHLIPRAHQATRYELRNGICLCRRCHKFCPDRAPHQNPAGFMQWLSGNVPRVEQWYTITMATGEHRRFNGTTNAAYYCEQIRRLKQYVPEEDYERIVGVKFACWLEEAE